MNEFLKFSKAHWKQTKKGREALIDNVLDHYDHKDLHPSPLKKPLAKHVAEKEVKDAKKKIKSLFDVEHQEERIEKGFGLVYQNLKGNRDEKLCASELVKAGKKLKEQLLKLSLHLDEVQNFVQNMQQTSQQNYREEQGVEINTFASEVGISPHTIVTIYEIGNKLYQEKKVDDALCVFELLLLLNPYCCEIWTAAGMCHLDKQELVKAIQNFTMACFMNQKMALPYLYNADCLIQVHEFHEAKINLEQAEKLFTEAEKEQFSSKVITLKKKLL